MPEPLQFKSFPKTCNGKLGVSWLTNRFKLDQMCAKRRAMESLGENQTKELVYQLVRYHPAVVFFSYLAAIAWFVTSMKTSNYLGR